MTFQPGKIELGNPPLALVLVQISIQSPIDVSTVRECLKQLGLERLTKKLQKNVSVNPTSLSPVVQDRSIFIFLDSGRKRGLSICNNDIAYFTADHRSFDSLFGEFHKTLECLGVKEKVITSAALRYVNAFKYDNSPTDVVRDSLGGLDRTGLPLPHHHHNYEFWSETNDGRLHTRFATDHGDRKPKHLGNAEEVYPSFIWSYDDNAGHLDIYEMANKLQQTPTDIVGLEKILRRMNLNIEQAFINAIKPEVMKNRFQGAGKD